MDWTVAEYDGERYTYWIIKYKGTTVFAADEESDAVWLADLFNRLGTIPPGYR